jgi:hypothetical protein
MPAPAARDYAIIGSNYLPTDTDTDVNAWLAAVQPLNGLPRGFRIPLLHDLVVGLKADGVWTKLDRLWIFAQELANGALVDLVARGRATAVGSPTFTPDGGFTGQDLAGPSKYIRLGYNMNTGPNYSQNSAHISVWNATNIIATIGGNFVGARNTGLFSSPGISNSDLFFPTINSSTNAGTFAVAGVRNGHWLVNRTGAALNDGYRNASLVVSPNQTSAAVSSDEFYALCSSFGGGSENGTPNQISAVSFGGSLTSGEITAFYNRLATYMAGVAADNWVRAVGPENVSAARRTAVTTLITGLMQDGVWFKLDRLWLFAAENEKSALVDLVGRTLATAVGSPTFTTDRGYTGVNDSTTVYIDSGYNFTTSAVNFTTNACHISAWCVTNIASTGNGGCLGGGGGGSNNGTAALYDTFSDGNVYARINDGTFSGSLGAPGTRAGHWIANRSGASATQAYQNGSLFGSPNAAAGSVQNINCAFLAYRVVAGVVSNGSPNQVAAGSVGGNLSSTDAANLYSRLRTYMTAVGVP